MTPGPILPAGAGPDSPVPAPIPGRSWHHKVAAVLFANFCFLVGVVLIAFPWLNWWESNYFSDFTPQWRRLWLNPFFRGAVSGLGVLDVVISVGEIFGLKRFSD